MLVYIHTILVLFDKLKSEQDTVNLSKVLNHKKSKLDFKNGRTRGFYDK